MFDIINISNHISVALDRGPDLDGHGKGDKFFRFCLFVHFYKILMRQRYKKYGCKVLVTRKFPATVPRLSRAKKQVKIGNFENSTY